MSERSIDTGSDDCLAVVRDDVAVITLNRPERRNALSRGMLEGLARALQDCELARDVRSIVLTGAGKGFCAGGDVKAMGGGGALGSDGPSFDELVHRQRLSQRETVGRIYRMPKPVIASLPGAAAGAGMGLAMACDMRIAAQSAVMVTAFARIGFVGDYGLPWLLPRIVGRAKALELFYLSERLSAEQCLAIGLLDRVVPDETLHDATMELASRLARGPAVSYRYIKENINKAEAQDLEDFMDGEVMRHVSTARTEDFQEAVQAFIEKREPVFKGK